MYVCVDDRSMDCPVDLHLHTYTNTRSFTLRQRFSAEGAVCRPWRAPAWFAAYVAYRRSPIHSCIGDR